MKYDTPRLRAKAAGQTRYEGLPCKYGHGNTRSVSNQNCVECRRLAKEKARQRVRENKPPKPKPTEAELEDKAKARRAWEREYWRRPENIATRKAKKAKRRCSKLQRTPKWLTKQDYIDIKTIYDLATAKTKDSGYEWHVDHIIPLRGKDVSGLHVPDNLRVIPALENLRKGNRLNS